ncbi:hypothetical protein CALCODRAFT_316091 [Calocera cornea HHB12733]|uniref:Uncharacterized protein n=1 Tax=Calocera cornea HHB12733 TaxID=1353952 RepID=A0A165FAE9_9BASI|nr:hypothetical protein CALCODRAFT_316091 [Calocera cornea HHB12733]
MYAALGQYSVSTVQCVQYSVTVSTPSPPHTSNSNSNVCTVRAPPPPTPPPTHTLNVVLPKCAHPAQVTSACLHSVRRKAGRRAWLCTCERRRTSSSVWACGRGARSTPRSDRERSGLGLGGREGMGCVQRKGSMSLSRAGQARAAATRERRVRRALGAASAVASHSPSSLSIGSAPSSGSVSQLRTRERRSGQARSSPASSASPSICAAEKVIMISSWRRCGEPVSGCRAAASRSGGSGGGSSGSAVTAVEVRRKERSSAPPGRSAAQRQRVMSPSRPTSTSESICRSRHSYARPAPIVSRSTRTACSTEHTSPSVRSAGKLSLSAGTMVRSGAWYACPSVRFR